MTQLPQIKIKGSLAERTYDTLRNAITNLELLPGEPLTEESISEQLGVSRTPIRSALNRLQREGLVDVLPGKGSVVAELTQQEVVDLFHLRVALERLAIQLAVDQCQEENVRELREILKKQLLACTSDLKDPRRFMLTDLEFHSYLAKITRNKYLQRQLEPVLNGCSRYTFAFSSNVLERSLEVYQTHIRLVDLLKQKDLKRLQDEMELHIREIESNILEALEKKRRREPAQYETFLHREA